MSLAITAVLPSGKHLPAVSGEPSWTGREVKDAISQHVDTELGTVAGLLFGDVMIGDDQTLESLSIASEEGRVDLSVVLTAPATFAEVVELPGMSNEYKFENWSAEEMYPGEEEEFRQKAAKTECYWLKPLAKDACKATLAMPEEWIDLWTAYMSENGGEEPTGKYLYGFMKVVRPMESLINDAIKQAIVGSYESMDRVDFEIDNNIGATCKYQIIDGSSRKPIKFADHETPLYVSFTGGVKFSKTEMEITISRSGTYLSDDEYSGVNKPFYC